MESEIFKFICANQGAVNAVDLMVNLGFGDSADASRLVRNRDRFAVCRLNGESAVVARTELRLCRTRQCEGGCRCLHLCKNFLYSGSCSFSRSRRGCGFSHELDTDHNEGILREHELESLSRTDLCTLLLQSDNALLPPICHDYNNGDGEFGCCQDGSECKRLHICEKYLNGDCSCSKSHNFNDPQPLNALQSKGIPDNLFHSLKSLYTNKEALRAFGNRGNRGNYGNRGNRGNYGNRGNRGNYGNRQQQYLNTTTSDASATACFPYVNSNTGLNITQTEWYRETGQGRGRNRGNRGNRRNWEQKTCSTNDIPADIDALDLYSSDVLGEGNGQQQQLNSSTSDISAAASDDASSESGGNRKQRQKLNKTSAAARGKGGNRGSRGNRQQLQKTSSTNEITSIVREINKNSDDEPNKRQRPVRDKTEICMYFIKGYCKHGDKCFKAHDKLPYRWEIKRGNQWTVMPDNETIEKDYCDPQNIQSSSTPAVHFDLMTCGPNKVRRLSTINSLVEPNFIHTTEWIWYWEDEFGKWNMYGSATGGHTSADINSAKLEQTFLDNDRDVVEFTTGSQSYSLSIQDMIQTNKHYGTKKLVRRRPQFVSAADVQAKRVRKPQGNPDFYTIPDHWDKTQITVSGFKRVSLLHSSDEFKEIEALFFKTMRGFDVVKIERIQNKALWEVFQWQKNQMKNNKFGSTVPEKQLFHGTNPKHIDAICLTNFDWRICGTHGTAFGKGSYFARDARYSHSYTGDSDVKSMFLSRVLVGDFTKGSSEYCRPPSKDGGDVNFYDSCVDDLIAPSVYVVFEKHQIYPEYLLHYRTSCRLVDLCGSTTVPRPATKPVPSVKQRTKVSHQPSLSVYQPSTSSYKPSPSVQPSTPSYKPSPSVQPSTPSYKPSPSVQPSTPSYKPRTLQYNPMTGTYNSSRTVTQPTQFSPPSSPNPNPRPNDKSDSCVIV